MKIKVIQQQISTVTFIELDETDVRYARALQGLIILIVAISFVILVCYILLLNLNLYFSDKIILYCIHIVYRLMYGIS